jgi:Xaa-Pro aminopeptidase
MPALLLFGDTERSPALRHEVPIATGDPLMFAEVDGRAAVLTSWLERERIARVLPDAELLDLGDFGWKELIEDGRSWDEAMHEVVTRAVQRLGIGEAIVPGAFPIALADRLRADGIGLIVDDEAVAMRRRVKAGAELDGIRAAQLAAEAGMSAAAALLASAEPGPDGRLVHDGEELHAEHVRAELRAACAATGAPAPPDVMVVSAWSGSGHDPGSGPLPAGLPITVDLWPRHEASGCWADMTRTFLVGEPTPEHAELIAEQEQLVRSALSETVAAARPGVSGRELHEAVCDLFEAAGYRTQRTGPGDDPSEGFQFSLGHGVGLEVHEAPTIGLAGREPLVAGDVIAVEPGLRDRRIGGVRLEDLLLVTEDGCQVLTSYPYELTPRA